MRERLTLLYVVLLLLSVTPAKAVSSDETPHYDVVAEYIRSLGAIHGIQRVATVELQEDERTENPSVAKLMSGIRSGTRTILELRTSIAALKKMSLDEPFETLLPMTLEYYKMKLALHEEALSIAKAVLEGPRPGADFKAMAGRMPEITATIEYIDESLFQMMPLVFGLLIDMIPDSQGHMSRLVITRAQRRTLVDRIDASFGESLGKEKKNWTVSAAALLKAYLLKDYTCKDEPSR
jgi:hypothetical protein